MKASEKRAKINRVLEECRAIAVHKMASWKPVDPTWEVVLCAVYIRLSTDQQVLVEKGSIEQQIHIEFQDAASRSYQNRKNYKIVEFFIEPPRSGQRADRYEYKP